MDFLPPCDSAASHYRVGLVSFGSGCVLVFQGGVFECSSRMKGNFQVRFLEGRVPAMAPGYSTPEVDISLNIFGAIGGQKRVVGVNFGSTNAKRDIPMYAQLYLQGRMNLDDLVSKR